MTKEMHDQIYKDIEEQLNKNDGSMEPLYIKYNLDDILKVILEISLKSGITPEEISKIVEEVRDNDD